MTDDGLSVWDKFDPDLYRQATQLAAQSASPSPEITESSIKRFKWLRKRYFWKALDCAAILFWTYLIITMFVTDLGRTLLTSLAPSLLWAWSYRFFVFILAILIIFLIFKLWTGLFVLIYIWIFPITLMAWHIPRLYFRRRSWNLAIGSFQIFWSLGKSVTFLLASFCTFSFAALAILLHGPAWLLKASAAALLLLWIWLLVRAIYYAIAPSSFVSYQQKLLATILESNHIWILAGLPESIKSSSVERLSKPQVDQLVSQATMGLALYAGSALWADKLNQYRKSGTSVVFSAFAVVALLIQGLAIFTLVNIALYRITPSQFRFETPPSFSTFVRYSLSSMYAGEINALLPQGEAANSINIFAALSCAVIILVLIVSVIFSLKQGRDSQAAEDAVQAMRKEADTFADKLAGEYKLPLIDLLNRITELGGLFSNTLRQVIFAAVDANRHSNHGEESG